jgi:hypothetical protein
MHRARFLVNSQVVQANIDVNERAVGVRHDDILIRLHDRVGAGNQIQIINHLRQTLANPRS